jgi:hypothetical protein
MCPSSTQFQGQSTSDNTVDLSESAGSTASFHVTPELDCMTTLSATTSDPCFVGFWQTVG